MLTVTRDSELTVCLTGRFLGRLLSPGRGDRYAEDCRRTSGRGHSHRGGSRERLSFHATAGRQVRNFPRPPRVAPRRRAAVRSCRGERAEGAPIVASERAGETRPGATVSNGSFP